jgi:integral membrane protein (TIGR01906 family)
LHGIKRGTAFLLGVLFSLCVIFILLISSVEIVCYSDPGYFEREYEKYDVLSNLPEMSMSDEDGLMKVTEHMMDYLRGDEDELQVEVMMGGELRGFFSDREIAHMEDVRELFLGAVFLRRAAFFIAAASAILIVLILRRKKAVFKALSRGMLAATAVTALACAALGLIFATDFTGAFITFHHIFFDNDLWILDPRVDMLINIVPEGFFFDTAARILILFVGSVLILCLISLAWLRRSKRQK